MILFTFLTCDFGTNLLVRVGTFIIPVYSCATNQSLNLMRYVQSSHGKIQHRIN